MSDAYTVRPEFLVEDGQNILNLGPFSAINTNLLTGGVGLTEWYDAEGLASISATIVGSAGISAGSILFEQTNDPTGSGTALPYVNTASNGNGYLAAATAIAANTTANFHAKITCRYIRIRISVAFVGGTVRCYSQMFEEDRYDPNTRLVSATIAGQANVTTTPGTPTSHNINSAASTNATSVKTSGGTITGLVLTNTNAAVRYFKLYNKASAPTVGTDIPILTIAVPTNGTVAVDPGVMGIRLGTGIAYAITGAATDADTTVITAGDFKVKMDYI